MREIRVVKVPFGTIFKIVYISIATASVLALALVLFLKLFIPFPQDQLEGLPVAVQAIMWLFYLVIGPILSALGLSFAGWLTIRVSRRLGWFSFRFEAPEEGPIQSLQRNAGSRPSSDDSNASETPPSLGPRG